MQIHIPTNQPQSTTSDHSDLVLLSAQDDTRFVTHDLHVTDSDSGRPGRAKTSFGDAGDKEKRLIVVSNRLPVTISKDSDGEYHFQVGYISADLERCGRGQLIAAT